MVKGVEILSVVRRLFPKVGIGIELAGWRAKADEMAAG